MSDSKNHVLKIRDVSKNFMLPHERTQSVKGAFVKLFKKRHKREVEVQHALRDISFEVKEGEFFGILGRNGSGKSTLLKIMAEIYSPTTGTVNVKGKLVPFIELGVGFNPELTGRENVYLNGALLGFSKAQIDAQYDHIVDFAELQDFMDQKLKNYSSGMQVRLAFSVAVTANADILLVDEVLAVGDADFQRKCFTYFKSLKKDKKTVIFVSHDMNAVREYCDKAILINEGVITHAGEAGKVADEYLRLFNPATNANVHGEGGKRWGNGDVRFDTITADYKQATDEVVIAATITAQKDVQDIVAGVRIKNSEGRLLAGANTIATFPKNLSIKANETVKLEWRMANIFSADAYTIDATLRQSDGVTFCDNWDTCASFHIERSEHVPYPVVPPVSLTLHKKESK